MQQKVVTVVDAKVPIPKRKDIAKFVSMCNEAVQVCNDERVGISEVDFGEKEEDGMFHLRMENESTYKQESHMDLVSYIQGEILEYPHSAALFEYRTNIVEVEEEDDQEEA